MFDVFITSSVKKSAKKLPDEVKKEVVKLCESHISQYPFDADKLQKPLDVPFGNRKNIKSVDC
ncbi:hypothetical protein KKB43_00010 [Patescibacteria group bacterium]|nr:hypothetical protein [Patescibacteria group bacterium]MBU4579385.1 hypothetical protein [Patescibacteria group bacterium]